MTGPKLTPYTGVCRFFPSVKLTTFLLASLVGGLGKGKGLRWHYAKAKGVVNRGMAGGPEIGQYDVSLLMDDPEEEVY